MIHIILHNIRSAYNVGSIFRTADGMGASKIWLGGFTPEPALKNAFYKTPSQKQIAKIALGAEESCNFEKVDDIVALLDALKKDGFQLCALEQTDHSIDYKIFKPEAKIALILGNEPEGIDEYVIKKCDAVIDIPMSGVKESLNVAVACGIAGYEICSKIK